jgi:hypothetical protein
MLELSVAAANHRLLAACGVRDMPLVYCVNAAPRTGGAPLAGALLQQAAVLLEVSNDLSLIAPPPLGARPVQYMLRLAEDVALCAAQLAGLLDELAARAATVQSRNPLPDLPYTERLADALRILRRAEGWLGTIDHVTGARLTLPGFTPGAPSLESQLALQ